MFLHCHSCHVAIAPSAKRWKQDTLQHTVQVIGVTDVNGILLCGIAASGTNHATNATFYGHTSIGTTVNITASFPAFSSYGSVTMDATWQPLQSITIVTTGKSQPENPINPFGLGVAANRDA